MFLFIYHIFIYIKSIRKILKKKTTKEKKSGDGMDAFVVLLYIHVLLLFCYHDDECYGNKIIE